MNKSKNRESNSFQNIQFLCVRFLEVSDYSHEMMQDGLVSFLKRKNLNAIETTSNHAKYAFAFFKLEFQIK